MSQVIRVPKIWGDRIAETRESSEGEKRSEGSLISFSLSCVFVSSWFFLAYGLGFLRKRLPKYPCAVWGGFRSSTPHLKLLQCDRSGLLRFGLQSLIFMLIFFYIVSL